MKIQLFLHGAFWKKGECISRFRKSDFNGSFDLSDGVTGGTTIYFGQKNQNRISAFTRRIMSKRTVRRIGDWNRFDIGRHADH